MNKTLTVFQIIFITFAVVIVTLFLIGCVHRS